MRKTSVLLADAHPVVRRGLRAVLEADPQISVVGESSDGLETVKLVEKLRPDVVLLSPALPGLCGLEVLRVVRQRPSPPQVVVFATSCDVAVVAQALKNGAIGYLVKSCAEEDLVRAVRAAALGKRFLSPAITEIAIDAFVAQAKNGALDPHDTLSPREREVLQLSAEGRTSADIASLLYISRRTVENHRAHIMRKLGLQNHSEMVRYAVRHGLVPLE